MNALIAKVGQLHKAGRKGQQRWRVKYWIEGEPKFLTKYLGAAEGKQCINRREAERLLARWLQEVGANPGKASKVSIPTLEEHIEHYLAMIKPRYSSRTYAMIEQSARYLKCFIGPRRRLDMITPTDADTWFLALSTGTFARYVQRREGKRNKCKTTGLADGTVRPHINNARHLFAAAMKRFPDHLRLNPFAHIRIKIQPQKGTWRYVPYADAVAVIEACTDTKTSRIGWQAMIALCRFAGLRKGEAFALEKRDVILNQSPSLIKVYASKTARATGMPSRAVPVLYPILDRLLVQAIGETSPAEKLVVASQLPRTSGSDHKTLMRILRRAKVPIWKPAFQVLRACFEKDMLDLGLPEADYARAVGHSPEVSRRFYLAKFEGAELDIEQVHRFESAARRLRKKLEIHDV